MYFEDFSAKFPLLEFHQNSELYFNPIQDEAGRGGEGGRGKKAPPTSFSCVTSTNQNFLTFSYNPFATLV